MVLAVDSVEENLRCSLAKESYWAEYSPVALYIMLYVQGGANYWFCE